MNDGEQMPKVDRAALKNADETFMKIIERENILRVAKLKRTRRTNLITGCLLGFGVLGIYGYTMYAIKQESFLDDFDEPAKTTN